MISFLVILSASASLLVQQRFQLRSTQLKSPTLLWSEWRGKNDSSESKRRNCSGMSQDGIFEDKTTSTYVVRLSARVDSRNSERKVEEIRQSKTKKQTERKSLWWIKELNNAFEYYMNYFGFGPTSIHIYAMQLSLSLSSLLSSPRAHERHTLVKLSSPFWNFWYLLENL